MLYRDPSLNVNNPVISGHDLARADLTKSQLAAFGAMVVLGERGLDDLTRKQVCAALNVSLRYLTQAIALSPASREAVGKGQVPLSDIPTVVTDKVLRKTICDAGIAALGPFLSL